jgi:hypothetical protein
LRQATLHACGTEHGAELIGKADDVHGCINLRVDCGAINLKVDLFKINP